MSITAIQSNLFYTKVTVQRRTNTLTTTGDFTEVWNNIATDVPCTIQPISERERESQELQQGKEFETTHKAYLPIDIVVIRHNDRLLSQKDGRTYVITGVQEHRASREDITVGHHYKLTLAIDRADKS